MELIIHVILLIKAFGLATGNPKYSYRFEVYAVDKCPMNSSEFEKAAKRRNCTQDTRYLCAPDKYLTNLIEFCSDIAKSLYGKGNCLRLDGTGDLNHYDCVERFITGCPTTPYTDEEIYKYPMCLAINRNLKCFAAERNCKEGLPSSGNEADRRNPAVFIAIIFVVFLILTIGIVGYVLYKRRRKKNKEENSHSDCKSTTSFRFEPGQTHTRTDTLSKELKDENEPLLTRAEAEANQANRGNPTNEDVNFGSAVVNIEDQTETPLTAACYKGEMNKVKELIKKGADVNQKDNEKTPLTTACYMGKLNLVEKLIQNKADINQGDGNETPLTAACHMGQLRVVEMLIKHGADVNKSDKNGTPLEIAYKRGHLSVVCALINANAEIPKIYEHDSEFWNLVA